jgi:hypothetical protein
MSVSFSGRKNKYKFRWRSRLIFAAATVHLSGCRVVGFGMRRVENVSRPRLSQLVAFLPALGLVLAATLPTLQDRCEVYFLFRKTPSSENQAWIEIEINRIFLQNGHEAFSN